MCTGKRQWLIMLQPDCRSLLLGQLHLVSHAGLSDSDLLKGANVKVMSLAKMRREQPSSPSWVYPRGFPASAARAGSDAALCQLHLVTSQSPVSFFHSPLRLSDSPQFTRDTSGGVGHDPISPWLQPLTPLPCGPNAATFLCP